MIMGFWISGLIQNQNQILVTLSKPKEDLISASEMNFFL